MAYRTILVHVDDSAHASQRIGLAASVARAAGAHLLGVATTGVSRFLYPSMPPDQNDPTLALHLRFLREQAQQALAAFSTQAEAAALVSCEARLIDDDAHGGISLHGRAADLIVISQAAPGAPVGQLMADLPAHIVMHSGRPVLLAPYAHACPGAGRRVVVAWDASRAAARALQLALPMLRAADTVDIAVCDTGASSHIALDALAADPRPYLARHGIVATWCLRKLERRRGRQRPHEVSQALLSLAADKGADLLVMGAYGHSRMRETILGGVTRTMFEAMTLPVLMVH